MLSNARTAYHIHDHERCVNAALQLTREICQKNKVNLTPTREQVLKLIWQSHRPIGAYQIQDQLARISRKSVAPPTVYRALQFLTKLGLIHKIPSLNSFIGCPFPNSPQSNLFLICEGCGNIAEVSCSNVDHLLQKTCENASFKLNSKNIELFGLCILCSESKPTQKSAMD
jgi:Fur family zinc uptake transcriptional regulator